MAELTPMMAQYMAVKSEYHDCILMFRLGDFYEMFFQDAEEASKILGITLTARNKNGENKTPMCGIPFHAIDQYLWKLTKAGKKVAICDQVSPPGKGIVERKVTRVVTPGTTFDDKVIESRANNYVATVVHIKDIWSLAIADLTTGEFLVSEFNSENNLFYELKKFQPTECLIEIGSSFGGKINAVVREFGAHLFEIEGVKNIGGVDGVDSFLVNHFKVKSLEVFGLGGKLAGIRAAGLLLHYLLETQKNELQHIHKITFYQPGDFMAIDDSLIRNLELFATSRDGRREGSLIGVLDNTLTAMGGRLIRKLLVTPLLERDKIEKRLRVVGLFRENSSLLREVRGLLERIYDIERLLSRLSVGSGNARDLLALKESLRVVPQLKALLIGDEVADLSAGMHELTELSELIEKAIDEEVPISVRDGGMIKRGYNVELDDLKAISSEGKGFIADLQKREIEKTGISNLKIKYNKVFGYHIEVSKANSKMVPDYYIRKQTLVNAERYFVPELKEYEDKVVNAEERIRNLEYELFYAVRMSVLGELKKIQQLARAIAYLDVYTNFAFNAEKYGYVRPEFVEGRELHIEDGRHPVVERLARSEDFVPNDCKIDEKQNFMLITGPNMGGKSTYLRQVAIAVLMAQIGSFVPAKSMRLGIVDKIFTRVGASDNLVTGDSTFMVEMQEAAYILNYATDQSLIILDEIGRGTSTYDGMSIAWAIMEYIHNCIGAKTLFATHYHELVELVEELKHAANYSVMVREKDGEVRFMYKVVEGAVSKSYGIEVAKLAGLPGSAIERAKEVLVMLEKDNHFSGRSCGIEVDVSEVITQEPILKTYEENRNHGRIVESLKQLDVNELTPLEALNKLQELKNNID